MVLVSVFWYFKCEPLTGHSVNIRLPRSRLTGCSNRSPLAHFYIHHMESSIRELHPFTTITHLASKNLATPLADDDFVIQFLFRKSSKPASSVPKKTRTRPLRLLSRIFSSKEQRVQSLQWTEKLARLVDRKMSDTPAGSEVAGCSHTFPCIGIAVHLEGPYFSPANPFRYNTVVCLVAGTGISGAVAIATAFTEFRRSSNTSEEKPFPIVSNMQSPPWRRCIIVWSVKAADSIELPFLEPCEGLEIRNHLTGPGRERVDLSRTLEKIKEADPQGRTWVYISGPNAFIDKSESACKAVGGLEWYAAKWDM